MGARPRTKVELHRVHLTLVGALKRMAGWRRMMGAPLAAVGLHPNARVEVAWIMPGEDG